jgi:hypothetical protein
VGILWLTENIDPAQEHFVSNLIRQKIIVAIDGLAEYKNVKAENFVLYLPDGQWHELSLLMSCYLIKRSGHDYIYLGSSLPIESVIKLKDRVSFNYIITTSSLSRSEEEIKQEFSYLASQFPDKIIFVGGAQSESLHHALPSNIVLMNSLGEFNKYLKQLKQF